MFIGVNDLKSVAPGNCKINLLCKVLITSKQTIGKFEGEWLGGDII